MIKRDIPVFSLGDVPLIVFYTQPGVAHFQIDAHPLRVNPLHPSPFPWSSTRPEE